MHTSAVHGAAWTEFGALGITLVACHGLHRCGGGWVGEWVGVGGCMGYYIQGRSVVRHHLSTPLSNAENTLGYTALRRASELLQEGGYWSPPGCSVMRSGSGMDTWFTCTGWKNTRMGLTMIMIIIWRGVRQRSCHFVFCCCNSWIWQSDQDQKRTDKSRAHTTLQVYHDSHPMTGLQLYTLGDLLVTQV